MPSIMALRRGYGIVIGTILLLLVTACGLTGRGGTRPDDMSVEEHRKAAREHYSESRRHDDKYDSKKNIPAGSTRDGFELGGYGPYRPGDNEARSRGGFNPTERHLGHASTHERHAQDHLAAAKALETFEESQCRSVLPETRGDCPLLGSLESVTDIPGGIRISFAEGLDVNAAAAHMRCHTAFARTVGHEGMDSCPLYLDGIDVNVAGAGQEVDLTADTDSVVRSLRQKTREHLSGSAAP